MIFQKNLAFFKTFTLIEHCASNLDELLHLTAARLVTLKVFERKGLLVNTSLHTELAEGSLQSHKNSKRLADQLGTFAAIFGFEDCLSRNSEIECPPGKRKFILWTTDQIKVAAEVYEHLTATSSKPLRLLVTGGKGSGKTFLLILIAKIAQTLSNGGECLVCDGTFYSYGLIQMLTETLSSVGVTVFDHADGITF